MEEWAEKACDEIDAGFFSGDTFLDEESVERIEYYLKRWQEKVVEIKDFLDEDM